MVSNINHPGHNSIVKAIQAIVCCLLLALLQVVGLPSVAGCVATPARHDCGCGGRMACCAAQQTASVPVERAVNRSSSVVCLFVPVPALGFFDFPSAGTLSLPPAVGRISPLSRSPLFLRNCALLI
jgi:hypothetical protein